MKKIIFLTLIIFAMNTNAQQVSPLQVSGSGWRYVGWFYNGGSFPYMADMYTFTFNGDTIIANNTYFKFYYSLIRYQFGYTGYTDDTLINSAYNGCLRSLGEKVFYIHKDSLTEILLYNYALTIGDTVPQGLYQGTVPFVITDTTTIQMEDGSLRKQYILNNWDPHLIIYGIGYRTGLLLPSSFVLYTSDYDNFQTYCEYGERVYLSDGMRLIPAENCDFPLSSNILRTGKLIDVHPNPCRTAKLVISTSNQCEQFKFISLISQLGIVVKEFNFKETNYNEFDLKGINSGYYLIKIVFRDGSTQYKNLIIQ
jgi:hypothetical protein